MNATTFNITNAPSGNFTASSNPIVVSPNGKNLYLAYGVINSESLYTASISAGVLTGIPAATISIGATFPSSIAVDNTGAFFIRRVPGSADNDGSAARVQSECSNLLPTEPPILSETVATPPNPGSTGD